MASNNGLLKFDCANLNGCIPQALFGYDFMSQRDMQLNAGHNLTHHIKGEHYTTIQIE